MSQQTVQVQVTEKLVMAEAYDVASAIESNSAADLAIERGKQTAAALELLPEGWSVVREDVERTTLKDGGRVFTARSEDGGWDAIAARRTGYRRSDYVEVDHRRGVPAEVARAQGVVVVLAALDAEGRA